MSDDRYRHLVRTGFAPLVEEVPEGPEWEDFIAEEVVVAAPPARALPGWAVGLAALAAVLLVAGLAILFSPLASPPTSEPVDSPDSVPVQFDPEHGATEVESWWSLVIDGDLEGALERSHPDGQFNFEGLSEELSRLGDDVEVFAEPDVFGSEHQPMLCYTLTDSTGAQGGAAVFRQHQGEWLIWEVRPRTVRCVEDPAPSEIDDLELLEQQLETAGSELDLGVPGGAWIDWGTVVCENPTDTNHLMTTADDLVVWAQEGEPASAVNTLLAAQLLWENSQILCPEGLTGGDLAAGLPTEYEYPECLPLIPVSLPWSELVGEPTRASNSDGVAEASWLGPAYGSSPDGSGWRQEMTVFVGRGDTFHETTDVGLLSGEIRGADAYVYEYDTGDSSGVRVGWANSGRWCDAAVVRLSPTPVSDPVDYVEGLLFPPSGADLNETEMTLIAAIDTIAGFTQLGGEPSHGGEDAWLAIHYDGNEYGIYATPGTVDVSQFGPRQDEVGVEGVDVSVYQTDQLLAAVFRIAGLSIQLAASGATQSELLETAARLIQAFSEQAGR